MTPALIIRELSLPASAPEANPAGEALHAQRLAQCIADLGLEEREPATLPDCIRFLETWLADASPANNLGQITFTRALCGMALDTMKAEVARQAARDNEVLCGE